MSKFFPASARHAKAREFLELKQGAMTVIDYVAKFIYLARFGDDYVDTGSGITHKGNDPRDMGHRSTRHRWDRNRYSLFLLTPVWVQGTSSNRIVLHKHLRQHKQAKGARV